MLETVKKSHQSGTFFIWLCGAGLAVSLLMIIGLLLLVMIHGLPFFWPKDLIELSLKDGSRMLGELVDRETIPESITPDSLEGRSRIKLKVGNRDLYGQDFRWIEEDRIDAVAEPPDATVLERREWGNFYGYFVGIHHRGTPVAGTPDELWERFQHVLDENNALVERIRHIERDVIGDINYEIEQARLAIREMELEGITDPERRAALEATIAHQQRMYEQQVHMLDDLRARSMAYTVRMREAGGQEIALPLGQIIRAVQPNRLSVFDKSLMALANVWTVLSDEPREANTEGGLFPAIFGTVMMVLIMSVAVVPFGVLAAFYLREYAEQGFVIRAIRIAVNNLAGVPSIVFGVFGLGFFVYLVGGTIDTLFYPEALPTPTFGTGGILWASLTLALMTVPVVIVSTEEGLSAVPREYREGSLALGATKFETMVKVVLPCAMPGILTGLI
ncbi:MAG: ABC transporter permease subunit, partial [Nitrospirae bacterium]